MIGKQLLITVFVLALSGCHRSAPGAPDSGVAPTTGGEETAGDTTSRPIEDSARDTATGSSTADRPDSEAVPPDTASDPEGTDRRDTEDPFESDAPETDLTEGTDPPEETDAQDETDLPEGTDAPAETDMPVETDTPVDTDAPLGTDSSSGAGIEWIPLPPGSFVMGSPADEPGRLPNEGPVEVTLSHGFEIAATEVTVAQWTALGFDLNETLVEFEDPSPSMPVTQLDRPTLFDWLDTLSRLEGLEPCYGDDAAPPTPYHCAGYRLPTEAEWEYAARAGTATATYAGDPADEDWAGLLSEIAWCAPTPGSSYRPVGMLAPNGFGLYDTLGNVWEVVEWLGVYPDATTANPYYFTGETSRPADRLLSVRGGYYYSEVCRAADRDEAVRGVPTTMPSVGFRPVRTLPGSDLESTQQGPESRCPGVAAATCESPLTGLDSPLLLAADAGEGAAFHAMAWNEDAGVLGTRASGAGDEVFLAQISIHSGEHTVTPLPDSAGVRPVAVVGWRYLSEDNEAEPRFAALLCEGSDCFLARSQRFGEDPRFERIPSGTVPGGTAEDIDRFPGGGVLVVGNGVSIFHDGVWQEMIPPDSGPRFHAVDVLSEDNGSHIAVAVGDQGRIALGDDDAWRELDAGVSETLTDVAIGGTLVTSMDFAAVGASGRLVTGAPDALQSCRISDRDLLRLTTDDARLGAERASLYIYSDAPEIIYQAPVPATAMPPCVTETLDAALLDFDLFRCNGLMNAAFLSTHGLFAVSGCGLV